VSGKKIKTGAIEPQYIVKIVYDYRVFFDTLIFKKQL